MDRRTFLGLFSISAIASSFPVALAACSNPPKKSTNNLIRADGFAEVGTVRQLTQEGQIVDPQSSVGPVIAVRTPHKTTLAVNPTCTHKGCTVSWREQEQDFLCPCHGARFGVDGAVLEGPAQQPLTTYETKIERDLVLIKVKGNGDARERSQTHPSEQPLHSKHDDEDDKESHKAPKFHRDSH